MAIIRGGGIGAQGRPRGQGRAWDAQMGRMDIVERGEAANQSKSAPWNKTPSKASISNERSDGRARGTESE